jgi:hypothetical protein
MRDAQLPLIRRPLEVADTRPESGAVRLCILAAYRSDDPASAGLLIASAYAPLPLIRPAIVDHET